MKRPFILIPMKGITMLAQLNGIGISTQKALEEIKELKTELIANQDDERILDESTDVINTVIQVLINRGLVERLPSKMIEKTKKGLASYGKVITEDLNIKRKEATE